MSLKCILLNIKHRFEFYEIKVNFVFYRAFQYEVLVSTGKRMVEIRVL